MKTEMIRFNASDNVELQGLYFTSESFSMKKSTVIHVHGLAGNFYENRFLDTMAYNYTENGYDFLVFNNRGHDYIADLVRHSGDGDEYFTGGAAYETFSDCICDIEGAIKYVECREGKRIILQGHSSGCNKIIYYLSKINGKDNIHSSILISPCDDIGLHLDAARQCYQSNQQLAVTMIQEGKEELLMPEGTLFSYPICARTYYDSFKENALQDVFPYRDTNRDFKQLYSTKIPLLVVFGSEDLLLQPFEEINEVVFASRENISAYTIKNASHSYAGKEDELVKLVINWLLSNEK